MTIGRCPDCGNNSQSVSRMTMGPEGISGAVRWGCGRQTEITKGQTTVLVECQAEAKPHD